MAGLSSCFCMHTILGKLGMMTIPLKLSAIRLLQSIVTSQRDKITKVYNVFYDVFFESKKFSKSAT